MLLLPPRLFPDAGYYVLMMAQDAAVIDIGMRYDKRAKTVHRYRIADSRGPLELTVPTVKVAGATSVQGVPWNNVGVSAHGRWWEVHRTALESAYGRTPFFEFYIDRFDGIFAPRPMEYPESIGDLVLRADAIVRRILDIKTEITTEIPAGAVTDLRCCLPECPTLPYWQVRADSLGFISGLSVLDLIFNLGPEAQIYLDSVTSLKFSLHRRS